MVMTRSTCRKAPNLSPSHAQPLAKKARSSKEVVKLQQLLKNMDINKKPCTSRGCKARKGASRPAVDRIPGLQAPHSSPNTCPTSFPINFESSLQPSPHAICMASLGAPVPTSSPANIPVNIQSTPSDSVSLSLHFPLCYQRGSCRLLLQCPVPLPPWMSTPPISQYTLQGVIAELEGFSIDQPPATPEEATSPAITTRWLPPAPAAEEPEDSSYDMSILQDALDDCGKAPQTNEYIHLGYHPAPRPRIVYRRPALDYSSCPYAPPPLEVGKVKKVRKYKVCYVATLLVIIY
jgi:hypothetical protein